MTRLRFTGSHKVLLRVTSFFNHRDSRLESLADRQKIAATVPSRPRSVAGPGREIIVARRVPPPHYGVLETCLTIDLDDMKAKLDEAKR
jgi:hypothetical protein